ncbi:hypothetical protein OG252_50155 [Streptomyces sp. NBC_01352]|uniref:hypothetical protein n=1 Tax=Streptomyces sp. NBC_01352 TaxID=2903834 RepID=UPI002E34731A|nr:hypothetical protein [Streptomyces sp. NBC_01352]
MTTPSAEFDASVYGRFKGIRTLNPLLATVCTPHSRPVIATVRTDRNRAAECAGLLNGGRGLPSGVESTRRNPGLRDQG